jgi:hypothetical protein
MKATHVVALFAALLLTATEFLVMDYDARQRAVQYQVQATSALAAREQSPQRRSVPPRSRTPPLNAIDLSTRPPRISRASDSGKPTGVRWMALWMHSNSTVGNCSSVPPQLPRHYRSLTAVRLLLTTLHTRRHR